MAWFDPTRLLCLLVSAMFGGGSGYSMGLVIGAAAGGELRFNAICGAAIGLIFCLMMAVHALRTPEGV